MVYTQARENILVQDRRSWSGESLLIMVSSPPPFLLFFFLVFAFLSFTYPPPPFFLHLLLSKNRRQLLQSSIPRGVIDVHRCLSVKGAEDVINKAHAFELSTYSETMFFIADSDKEKEEWISSVGRAIVRQSKR